MKKRALSLLLALCLCLGCLPLGAAAKAMPFKDVKPTDWFYDDVQYVYDNSLMTHRYRTSFEPNRYASRITLAEALYNMQKYSKHVRSTLPFTDVNTKTTARYFATWADSRGIANGTEDHKFSPDGNVTREQAAAMFYRYAVLYKGASRTTVSLSTFPDANKVSSYAREAMAWCVANNIIVGSTNNGRIVLDPKGTVTRAHLAAFVHRISKLSFTGTGYEKTITSLINDQKGLNRATYADLTGDGKEELILSYTTQMPVNGDPNNLFDHQVVSVYTIRGCTVQCLLEKKILFALAGGPNASVGAFNDNGKTKLCIYTKNGETGGLNYRYGESYTLYTLSGGKLAEEKHVGCTIRVINGSISTTASNGSIKENGKITNITYNHFRDWQKGAKWGAKVRVYA